MLIKCPKCGGLGKKSIGLACPSCGGLGMGVFRHGYFFYWKPQLGIAIIELKDLRKKLQLIINMIAFAVGVIGFAFLFWWIYETSKDTILVQDFAFWRYRDWRLLIFWLSAGVDMFVVFRIARDTLNSQKIKIFKYDDKKVQARGADNWDELKKDKNTRVDVSRAYSDSTFRAVDDAFLLAMKLGHAKLEPLHLFFSCLSHNEVTTVFARLNVDNRELLTKIKKYLALLPEEKGFVTVSPSTKQVLIDAYLEASDWGQKIVMTRNLLIPCLQQSEIIHDILYDLGLDEDKIINVLLWFLLDEKQLLAYKKYRKLSRFKPSTSMDRAYTAVATPILNNFGYDMTIAAKWNKLEFCVAREEEIEEIWQHFEGDASGILLVGPVGTGKRTLVSGIAQRMVEEDVPLFLRDKRLIELDIARLISGSSPAQSEGIMMAIIDEVGRAGNIVLFINNIDNISGISSGNEGSLDLAEVLANAIDRRLIFCLGSCSAQNYLKYLEGKSLDLVMRKVEIEEPQGNKAIQIIESKISPLESKYGVYYSYSAIEKAVEFSGKYMHDSYLPEKAIKILQSAAVKSNNHLDDLAIITAEDVAKVVAGITDIPLAKITEKEGKKLLNLEDEIHKQMVNQEEAVKMVASSLRRARTELRDGLRPIANFLFLGPTGVGKTELAKTVANIYFGVDKYMIRIDMSEYQHEDSVKKMIGDSSGAKGYLTEKVRQSPFSLVLLDEVEKAHPEILNLFLQVMDDGRLTDGQGRTIDFSNSIIIATSNAGALYIQNEIFAGTDIETIRKELINKHLNRVMRPELINRFDGVIVFEPLSRENVVDITKLMLKKIAKMLELKGIEFSASDEGIRVLAKLGYDPKFGARPLRRLLQDRVENQIANKILSGGLKRRDTVLIDKKASILVEKAEPI